MSAFATPDGLYQYRVMPFGMRNSPATFQRLINRVISGLTGCEAYIDDLVLHSDSWNSLMQVHMALFDRLRAARLTVNLAKSEFCQATVQYLGYVVGQVQIKPVTAKIDAILRYPAPRDKKSLMRFLGTIGYYRRFCVNLSSLINPLTNLLGKNVKFIWSKECSEAFERVKRLLMTSPVLITANYEKQFSLYVDASDVGIGAVLTQLCSDDVDHPISFYSKKLNKHQRNYSTIEKECFSLVSALHHYDVYVNVTRHPVLVYTDHNPFVFIERMKQKSKDFEVEFVNSEL